jgi:phenylacetate-CoA ligase
LTQVEGHLGRLTSDAYLLDEHHAIASGGSSGRRGVYVYDWDGWASYFLGMARRLAYDRRHDPILAAAPGVESLIAADKPSHGSSAQGQTFSNPQVRIARIPITLPLPEVVAWKPARRAEVTACSQSVLPRPVPIASGSRNRSATLRFIRELTDSISAHRSIIACG